MSNAESQRDLTQIIKKITASPDGAQIARGLKLLSDIISFAKEIPANARSARINNLLEQESVVKSLLSGTFVPYTVVIDFIRDNIDDPIINLSDLVYEKLPVLWARVIITLNAFLLKVLDPAEYNEIKEDIEQFIDSLYRLSLFEIIQNIGVQVEDTQKRLDLLVKQGKLSQANANGLLRKMSKINKELINQIRPGDNTDAANALIRLKDINDKLTLSAAAPEASAAPRPASLSSRSPASIYLTPQQYISPSSISAFV